MVLLYTQKYFVNILTNNFATKLVSLKQQLKLLYSVMQHFKKCFKVQARDSSLIINFLGGSIKLMLMIF